MKNFRLLIKKNNPNLFFSSDFWITYFVLFFFGILIYSLFPLMLPNLFQVGMISLLKDPFYFHDLAIKTATASWSHFDIKPEGQLPAGVLALVYKTFGVHKPFMMLPILAFLGSTTVKVIGKILELFNVTGRWWPLIIGFFFTVTPTSISWMVYPHKDAFIVPGVLFITWSYLSFMLAGFQWSILLSFIWGVILVIGTKTYFSEILFVCTIVIFFQCLYYSFAKRSVISKKSLLFFFISTMIFGIISLLNNGYLGTSSKDLNFRDEKLLKKTTNHFRAKNQEFSIPEIYKEKINEKPRHIDLKLNWKNIPGGKIVNKPFEALAYTRERFLYERPHGNTNFLENVKIRGTLDAILFIPRALQLSLLEPLPFRSYDHSLPHKFFLFLSQTEMLIFYVFVLLLLFSGKNVFSPRVIVCLSIALPFLIVLGFAMPNIGTVNRYRFPFVLVIKIAGFAALWSSARHKWPGRLLMWIDPPVLKRNKNKVLFLVPDDATFIIQRLVMAQGVQRAGYDVHVACPDFGHSKKIESLGFTFHHLDLNRGGLNPFADFIPFLKLVFFLAKERPDILQCVSIKPVIYGATAGTIVGLKKIVCLINGLGYAFEGNGLKGKFVLSVASMLYRNALAMPGVRVIFQNPDDQSHFIKKDIVNPRKTILIKGSGVDMKKFVPTPMPQNIKPVILFVGRLLWSKGIRELIEAAESLKNEGYEFELKIVGSPDGKNPEAVPEEYLISYHHRNIINWVGRQSDMPKFYRNSDIIVLPTEYREGLPLTLLEAASTGRPLIATDMPGCREIVRDSVNGFLIPIRDVKSLEDALKKLIINRELREIFGHESSIIVENEFSSEIVQKKLLAVYAELLADKVKSV